MDRGELRSDGGLKRRVRDHGSEQSSASFRRIWLVLCLYQLKLTIPNNIIEQDHRFIRRRWRAMQTFRSFHTAERTIEGIEALHMLHKGQVKRLDGGDAMGQAKFVASLFQVAA